MVNMYNITIKGYFETEKAEEFVKKLEEIVKETDSNFIGKPVVYELAPYVDYQKQEDGDEKTEN